MKRLFLSLFLLLFLAGAVFITWFGINWIQRGKAATHWPTTKARIARTEIAIRQSKGTKYYGPKIEYEYAIGNEKISGRNIAFGTTDQDDDDRRWAEKYLAKYPVGKTVTVFFNPADPHESVLEPGTTRTAYIVCACGLVAILFVLRFLYVVNFNDPLYGTPAELRKKLEGLKS